MSTQFWLATPLTWCQLDEAWLVFQAGNGIVCEVDGLSALVLSMIEQQSATADELRMQLAEAAPDSPDLPDLDRLQELLARLCHVGLIDQRRVVAPACD